MKPLQVRGLEGDGRGVRTIRLFGGVSVRWSGAGHGKWGHPGASHRGGGGEAGGGGPVGERSVGGVVRGEHARKVGTLGSRTFPFVVCPALWIVGGVILGP